MWVNLNLIILCCTAKLLSAAVDVTVKCDYTAPSGGSREGMLQQEPTDFHVTVQRIHRLCKTTCNAWKTKSSDLTICNSLKCRDTKKLKAKTQQQVLLSMAVQKCFQNPSPTQSIVCMRLKGLINSVSTVSMSLDIYLLGLIVMTLGLGRLLPSFDGRAFPHSCVTFVERRAVYWSHSCWSTAVEMVLMLQWLSPPPCAPRRLCNMTHPISFYTDSRCR